MLARRLCTVCLVAALAAPASTIVASAGAGQQRRQPIPRPFPSPRTTDQDAVETPAERTQTAAPTAPAETAPTEAIIGLPIYPNARFITSYDAGRGQRFYLFGTNSSFEEMVSYYSVVLDERGDRVFDGAAHMFEVGRFREQEMAFPPGVTIKDYTWNGSDGYLNPAGGEPARFKTVIQLVPAPAGQTQR